MTRLRCVVGGSVLVALLAMSTVVPGAGAQARAGRVHPFPGSALAVARHATTNDSANWSGYAVVTPAVTAVYTTFAVPAVKGVQPGFAATWAGIGGATTKDLIQAGVEENNDYGTLGGPYYAWYELLPDSETVITGGCSGDPNCTVTPGDTISVDIHVVDLPTNTWSIALTDIGKWKFAKTVHYVSSMSSAEWIFEAISFVAAPTWVPAVENTTFGPLAHTRGNQFATHGGRPRVLATGNPDTENMAIGFVVPEASPSPIAPDGNGFTVCAYSSSCRAPAT